MGLQSRILPEELLHQCGAVGLSSIPEQNDRSPTNVPEEVAEEPHHLRTPNGGWVNSNEELPVRSDGADRRELGPPSLVDEGRRDPPGGPGLPRVGDQGETALVEEDEDGSSVPGFFLNRGQEWRFQLATALTFFSRA